MRDWRGTGAAAERRQEAHRGLYYWHSSVRGCRGVWRVCTAVSASECLCAVSAAAIVRLCVSCVMCTLFVSLRSSHIDTPHCTRQIHTRQDTRAECVHTDSSTAHITTRDLGSGRINSVCMLHGVSVCSPPLTDEQHLSRALWLGLEIDLGLREDGNTRRQRE